MRGLRAVTFVALVCALAGASAPAYAADEIGVSRDGVTWQSSLTEPLFDDAMRWVPGDVETRTVYVRNQAEDPGALSIAVITDESWLLDEDDVRIEARVDDGSWVSAGASRSELRAGELREGGIARVDVRVTAVWESPNATQTTVLPLELVITLTDAAADAAADGDGTADARGDQGADPDDADADASGTASADGGADGAAGPEAAGPGAPDDGLAATGAVVGVGSLWAAAILIGGGLSLAARRGPRAGEGDPRG